MAECPTCKDTFKSEQGMKVHHKRQHGESISGVAVDCDNCGDTIRRRKSRVEEYEYLFCDRDCKDEFHSEYLTGRERPEHGELISEMFQGENNPAWKDGSLSGNWRNTAKWQRTRAEAVERDGGECQVCGDSDELHAHHIQPVSEGGAKFDTENLITLCPEHHYDRH